MKYLFVKTEEIDVKINDWIIGNLNSKCSIGQLISINDYELTITIYDENSEIYDVITINKFLLGINFFKANKIELNSSNKNYIVIDFKDEIND